MTEAEIYQKQVETCKQVQDMINKLYISKDKIRDLQIQREFELQQQYIDFEFDKEWLIYKKLLEEN